MPKARKHVHLKSPTGERIIVAAGEEVPEWANLPESALEQPPPAKKAPAKKKRAARKATPKTWDEIQESKVPIPGDDE